MVRWVVYVFILGQITLYGEPLNRIVARVNNEVITYKDVESYLKMFSGDSDNVSLRQKVLERLIEEKLILSAARKEKIQIPQTWVDSKIDKIRKSYDSDTEFEQSLVEQGINMSILRKRITDDLMVRAAIEEHVTSQISITPKEITDYYNSHISDYSSPKKYVCWIAKSGKVSFLQKLGEDIRIKGIAKVIEEHKDLFFKIESDESGFKEHMKTALESLKEGTFTITEIEDAYYLIYLVKIIPSYQKFIDEVKDDIYNKLWESKFNDKLKEWVDELKKKSVVKIYEKTFSETPE